VNSYFIEPPKKLIMKSKDKHITSLPVNISFECLNIGLNYCSLQLPKWFEGIFTLLFVTKRSVESLVNNVKWDLEISNQVKQQENKEITHKETANHQAIARKETTHQETTHQETTH